MVGEVRAGLDWFGRGGDGHGEVSTVAVTLNRVLVPEWRAPSSARKYTLVLASNIVTAPLQTPLVKLPEFVGLMERGNPVVPAITTLSIYELPTASGIRGIGVPPEIAGMGCSTVGHEINLGYPE